MYKCNSVIQINFNFHLYISQLIYMLRIPYTYVDADDSNSNSSILNRSKLLVEFDVSESIGMGMNTMGIREEIIREVDMYFGTKPSLNIEAGLRSYPNIRRVFLKFNCIRSSEAICERMFSYAGSFLYFFSFCSLHCPVFKSFSCFMYVFFLYIYSVITKW